MPLMLEWVLFCYSMHGRTVVIGSRYTESSSGLDKSGSEYLALL